MLKRNLSSMAMSLVEVIVGILLLVAGLFSIVKYFRAEPEEAAVSQSLVKGLVLLLVGAFCAFKFHWFIATFPVLTLVYGVVILFAGITKLQWTVDIIRTKRSKWVLAAISAAISILCGIIIITSPFSSTAVLWMFAGISLIVEAVFDMIGSIFSNREKKTSDTMEENHM